MPSPTLVSLYQANALAAPSDLLKAALKQEEWKLAASLCLELGDCLSPLQITQALAESLQLMPLETHAYKILEMFEPHELGKCSGLRNVPPFVDDWLLGLLEAGLDPQERLKGVGEARQPWEGSVHTLAVLLDAPKTLAELARRSPVAGWASEEVIWGGESTSLLHLACATGRWHAALFLTDHGFPRHLKDKQGGYPWERVSGDADVCLAALDGTRLWPRDEAEMNEGWKRRGVSTSQYEGPRDKAWRKTMIERMGQGGDFELAVAIEHLLKVTENRLGQDWINAQEAIDIVGLWNRLSTQDRERAVDVRKGLIRGRWSMVGALCWVAAWTKGALSTTTPQGVVEPWKPLHLNILEDVAPTISAEELDRPIVQRKAKGGDPVVLTARGLLGVAHAGAERTLQPWTKGVLGTGCSRPRYTPVSPTPAWAQTTLEAWALLAAQVKPGADALLLDFKRELMERLCHERLMPKALAWDATFQPLLDLPNRLKLWAQVEKGKGTWEYALWLWDHPPKEPLPTKVLTSLPSPLEGVADGASSPALATRAGEWLARTRHLDQGEVLASWAAWGWTVTQEQLVKLGADLDTIQAGMGGAFVAAHREAQASQRQPSASSPSVRRPRVRS